MMSDQQSNGNGTGPRGGAASGSSRRARSTRSGWPDPRRVHDRGGGRAGGVDRSTIMKLRMVARQGALDALAASKPGVRAGRARTRSWRRHGRRSPGYSEAIKEMGVRLMLAEGKGRWD